MDPSSTLQGFRPRSTTAKALGPRRTGLRTIGSGRVLPTAGRRAVSLPRPTIRGGRPRTHFLAVLAVTEGSCDSALAQPGMTIITATNRMASTRQAKTRLSKSIRIAAQVMPCAQESMADGCGLIPCRADRIRREVEAYVCVAWSMRYNVRLIPRAADVIGFATVSIP